MEAKLLHVFGYYWHLMVGVATVLRDSEIDHSTEDAPEKLKDALQATFTDRNFETLLANATDDNEVDQHCPDFAILVNHDHKLVVINICGTRMIPAPKMSDVFMDLYATGEPFLNGHGHRGMVIGARNILSKSEEVLNEALANFPDYGVLVTGYSLGAGICQLVAMQMQDTHPKVKCISYGAPLVFASDEDHEDLGSNLYTVVCSHDGLASASLCTVTRLLQQVSKNS